jgi:hypothetical protein
MPEESLAGEGYAGLVTLFRDRQAKEAPLLARRA